MQFTITTEVNKKIKQTKAITPKFELGDVVYCKWYYYWESSITIWAVTGITIVDNWPEWSIIEEYTVTFSNKRINWLELHAVTESLSLN